MAGEGFGCARHVAGGGFSLAARIAPAFETHMAIARLCHGRTIAGRKDMRVAGAQECVRQDTVDGEPRLLSDFHIRHHADGGDDDIGRNHGAIGEHDGSRSDLGKALPEMEVNPFFAMPRLQTRRKTRRHGAPERLRRRLDDMHADTLAAQHRRKLHADQPTADDCDGPAGRHA